MNDNIHGDEDEVLYTREELYEMECQKADEENDDVIHR